MKKRILIFLTAFFGFLLLLTVLYFSVTFEITLQATGDGTLQAEKLCVHPLESVQIRITPGGESGYTVLRYVTVNGKDRTDEVHFQTLRLRHVWGDQTVCAEFQSGGEFVSANAAVFV